MALWMVLKALIPHWPPPQFPGPVQVASTRSSSTTATFVWERLPVRVRGCVDEPLGGLQGERGAGCGRQQCELVALVTTDEPPVHARDIGGG